MSLPARLEHREIRSADPKDRLLQLCEAALKHSNENNPAVIVTVNAARVRKLIRELKETLPTDPEFQTGVVDVLGINQCPLALTQANYAFFGVDEYFTFTEREKKKLRPDFCDAKVIVTAVNEEFEVEIPDWIAWDRARWPEGPHYGRSPSAPRPGLPS